ncbi:MAG: proteasome subunit beta, partial [Myxococcota bacterium]
YEELEFDATGSGGLYARESLKHGWNAEIGRDEAIRVSVAALTAAADEDRATGGVDLERGIYPSIRICTAEGQAEASEDEIAACYRSILEARAAGGNL